MKKTTTRESEMQEYTYAVSVKPRIASEWHYHKPTTDKAEAVSSAEALRQQYSDKLEIRVTESYTFNTVYHS